jgi:hypothetical protein
MSSSIEDLFVLATLEELLSFEDDDDSDFFAEIVNDFFTEADECLAGGEKSAYGLFCCFFLYIFTVADMIKRFLPGRNEGNCDACRDHYHKLKGISRQIGCRFVPELAEKMQASAEENDLVTIKALIPELSERYSVVHAFLTDFIAKRKQ